MLLLAASLIALFVGPLILTAAGGRLSAVAAVDGFVLVALVGMVFFHLLPEAYIGAGSTAFVAAVAGLAAPAIGERLVRSQRQRQLRFGRLVIGVALLGLAVHAMIDGAALALDAGGGHGHVHEQGAEPAVPLGDAHDHSEEGHRHEDDHAHGHEGEHEHEAKDAHNHDRPASAHSDEHADEHADEHGEGHREHHDESPVETIGLLALGVLLHRIPIGLTIWWLLTSRQRKLAISILLTIALATVVGFALGRPLFEAAPGAILATFEAFVSGLLLHVVFAHGPRADYPYDLRSKVAGAVGALLAVAAVVGVARLHPIASLVPEELESYPTLYVLAAESAPALLLAFFGAGLLQVFLSPASSQWLRRGGPASQATRGLVFGLPLPVCSCGVVPVYRSLYKAGVPAAAAMAFLVATPEIGLDAILISIPMLGVELAIARVVCAALVALTVGVLVGRSLEQPTDSLRAPYSTTVAARLPLSQRVLEGIRFGFGELFDHVAPWLIVGLIVAAMVEPLLHAEWFGSLPPALQVPIMALVGMPSYVCASGATPLVAMFMHKGLAPGAAIAFLLTGPATNVVTFGLLRALHGRRVAIQFGVLVAGLSVLLGWIVNATIPAVDLPIHELAEHGPSTFKNVCLVILVALAIVSIGRQGPRSFIEQLWHFHDHAGGDGHNHDHHHGHHHHHDHDHDHGGPPKERPSARGARHGHAPHGEAPPS